MKVLLTGCSSPQTSKKLNSRLPTFSGLVYMGLVGSGHDVDWLEPSIRMSEEDLKQYDVVVVGLTNPTSLSAYRLYGALSVAYKAKKVTSVRYLVDAPEPYKLIKGIKALSKNPNDIVKNFYSSRAEFSLATNPDELFKIQEMIVSLAEDPWERTLFPAFPWSKKEHIKKYIPNLSEKNIELMCLDSFILSNLDSNSLYIKDNSSFWSTDSFTPWVRKLEKTISNKVEPMMSSKWDTNSQVLTKINKSIGSIISVYKNDEPWWSANLCQSLHVSTPVVTDWRHTSFMGESWSVLGHQIEELSISERSGLASKQKIEYIKQIPNISEAVDRVLSSVFTE